MEIKSIRFYYWEMEDKTMMKFTMNAKELKTMMEKGISAINKKLHFPLSRSYIFKWKKMER